jgi:hypothetical protein
MNKIRVVGATLVQLLAAALLLALLWSLFRFAMGLRWAKLSREEQRRSLEAEGKRVVAELPLEAGVVFLLEDAAAFAWGAARAEKAGLLGARLLLNGAVIREARRGGAELPSPPVPEEYDGRERWDVVLYLRGAAPVTVPCGTRREGVSREAASAVFEAVRIALGDAEGA